MTTQTKIKPESDSKPGRRYDIDWLRVLAVLLLLPFHSARIFDTWGYWYVKNLALSQALTYFNEMVYTWHMPLLFLLAGASTWFALRFRTGGQYLKERFTRLLVPLLFGVLILVPPQSYLGFLGHSGVAPSFLQWYPDFFSLNPADPDGYFLGGFTLAHMWFVAYLLVFSLVALPFFLFFMHTSWKRLTERLVWFFTLPGMIFLFAIPSYLVARLMGYPNPVYFLVFFLYGYILISDARFGETIDKHKTIALVLGPVLYAIVPYFKMNGWPEMPGWFTPILIAYVDGFAPWFFTIVILGFGKRLLGFTNKFLRYTAEASYPVYILHQTIIVIIGFYVVRWSASIPLKYTVILVGSTIATFLLYDLLVKRIRITRLLLGMRVKK